MQYENLGGEKLVLAPYEQGDAFAYEQGDMAKASLEDVDMNPAPGTAPARNEETSD